MKISFITTIYNEEQTIKPFIDSILKQTKVPDEIIIVDGGSRDGTVEKIKDIRFKIKDSKSKFVVLVKKGNRSVGRNEAIKKATGDIIVCSDAGNILDKNWVKNIISPFANSKIDVVAGYYQGLAKNIFQKCLIPYVLVMPDKINPNAFLPATRSIAFTKSIWGKVGGFNEKFSHNEDYAFAIALQKINAKIIFKKDAVVYWIPRTTFKQSFVMFFRFAYGDAEAKIYRPKVFLLFLRYIIGIVLLILFFITKSLFIGETLLFILVLYLLWAVAKNYRYVNDWQAFYYLPLLQIISDAAVLSGSIAGYLSKA